MTTRNMQWENWHMGSLSDKLEVLRLKRESWVQANCVNNFDEGIKRLMYEMYPDSNSIIRLVSVFELR
ncbi:MAG: hypothetical protein J0665_14840 [Deltaproteobacteria bacterium]|nr:hypothetical protein [Deltaproteobacteria bacterium]